MLRPTLTRLLRRKIRPRAQPISLQMPEQSIRIPEINQDTLPPINFTKIPSTFYETVVMLKSFLLDNIDNSSSRNIIVTNDVSQNQFLNQYLGHGYTITFENLLSCRNDEDLVYFLNLSAENKTDLSDIETTAKKNLKLTKNISKNWQEHLSLLEEANVIFLTKPLQSDADIEQQLKFLLKDSRTVSYLNETLSWSDINPEITSDQKFLDRQFTVKIATQNETRPDYDPDLEDEIWDDKKLENLTFLKKKSVSNIFNEKFKTPNTLQKYIWGLDLKSSRNIFLTAPTGTGKTLAFLEILAQYKLDAIAAGQGPELEKNMPFALILTPNYELINQINSEIEKYYSHILSPYKIIRRQDLHDDIFHIKQSDVVVASPYLYELFCRKWWTKFKSVKFIVVDEADHLLRTELTLFNGPDGHLVETFGRGEFAAIRRIFLRYTDVEHTILNSATLKESYLNVNVDQLLRAGILDLPITKVDMQLSQSQENEEENTKYALNPRIHYYFADNFELNPSGKAVPNNQSNDPNVSDPLELAIGYAQSVLFNGQGNSKIIFATPKYESNINTIKSWALIKRLRQAFGAEHVYFGNAASGNNNLKTFKSSSTKYGVYVVSSRSFNTVDFRGLDIEGLDAMIMEKMPNTLQDFIHVSGRVARGEFNRGICVTVVSDEKDRYIKEQFLKLFTKVHE